MKMSCLKGTTISFSCLKLAFPSYPSSFQNLPFRRTIKPLSAALQTSPATSPSTTKAEDQVARSHWKAAIDFKWIKDNKEAVAANIRNRNSDADLELVLQLYDRFFNLQKEGEEKGVYVPNCSANWFPESRKLRECAEKEMR
ncbi:Serine--tRNA ligase/mitochondrial [Arachis hypogaea]|nr:Serine--tRNA ligase/mitochondrial [Arachis hypogaea]